MEIALLKTLKALLFTFMRLYQSYESMPYFYEDANFIKCLDRRRGVSQEFRISSRQFYCFPLELILKMVELVIRSTREQFALIE